MLSYSGLSHKTMSDLVKIIRLDERFPVTGEPTVQLITPRMLENVKLASEAGEYVKNVQPVPGKTIVLVLAMSAGEYYGPNRNGDAFSERAVPGAVAENETLPNHYKSFESYAHVYRHHINKDPAKSMGRVQKAFYNWEMHRVELILELDNVQAQDIVSRIEAGEYPAVSMGCSIKYDVCSICGNKAPTRAQYCDHAKYEMNRNYPDGRKAFVWNPAPKLFDISFVTRPADRIGFMMKKVAHDAAVESSIELGDAVKAAAQKQAVISKLSDIDKIIRGQAVAATPANNAVKSFVDTSLPHLMERTPPLDDKAIGTLAEHPLPEALSTCHEAGITPTSVEITKIMIRRAMPGAELPQRVQDNMSAMQGGILELFKQHPEILNALEASGMLKVSSDLVNKQLLNKLSGWMEKRSDLIPYLERRIFTDPSPAVGNWDQREFTDPKSGKRMVTTHGAMNLADDVNTERSMKTLAGAGLLAGAGYKVLSAKNRALAPLLAATAGYGALAHTKRRQVPKLEGDKSQVIDQLTGETWNAGIPINAEHRVAKQAETAGVVFPLAASALATAALANEYNHRQDQGTLGQNPTVLNRVVEGVGETAATHPAATFLSGLAGIALAGRGGAAAHQGLKNVISKFGSFIAEPTDTVKLAEVDLDGLATWIGEGLFSL